MRQRALDFIFLTKLQGLNWPSHAKYNTLYEGKQKKKIVVIILLEFCKNFKKIFRIYIKIIKIN